MSSTSSNIRSGDARLCATHSTALATCLADPCQEALVTPVNSGKSPDHIGHIPGLEGGELPAHLFRPKTTPGLVHISDLGESPCRQCQVPRLKAVQVLGSSRLGFLSRRALCSLPRACLRSGHECRHGAASFVRSAVSAASVASKVAKAQRQLVNSMLFKSGTSREILSNSR